ncbi:MAG: hypothetical protein R3E02_05560 [Blastomonas sp.]
MLNIYGKQAEMAGKKLIVDLSDDSSGMGEGEAFLRDRSHEASDGDILDSDEQEQLHENRWLDEEPVRPPRGGYYWAISLGLIALLWIAFFFWGQWQTIGDGLTPGEGADLIVQGSIPLILLAAIYLLARRHSTAEAQRFDAISRSLREESDALHDRMSTINGELSLAREFLANQSRELESLGRVSTDRLRQCADELQKIVGENEARMRTIGEVSEASSANMEKLRAHLPVIANSAKDVTNQIGNAGRTAQGQVGEMIAAFDKLNQFGQAADRQISVLRERATEAENALSDMVTHMIGQIESSSEALAEHRAQNQSLLADTSQALQSQMQEFSGTLDERIGQMRESNSATIAELTDRLDDLARSSEEHKRAIGSITGAVQQQLDEADSRLVTLNEQGSERTARLAFALSAIDDDLGRLASHFSQEQGRAEQFLDQADSLLARLEANRTAISEAMPEALADLDTRSSQSLASLESLRETLGDAGRTGDQLASRIAEMDARLAEHRQALSEIGAEHDSGWNRRNADISGLIEQVQLARQEADDLASLAETRLAETLRDVQRNASEAGQELKAVLGSAIADAAEKLGKESRDVLERNVRAKAEEVVGKLEAAVQRAIGATGEASLHLKDQLVKVDELTSHLERRVAEARERAEESTDNAFARRVALLNESLNSTSIDIARVIAADVSSTSWAAYLKGDRGIFTRRAVRLLDSGEVKEIAQFYADDPDFAEQVNRFIHDFEAMLRNVLSTRDGGVIGVTLLSSDTGKLYVALAQAIERLRD